MKKGIRYEFYADELDEDYEPTDKDVEEHALYLGIDLANDRHLLVLARAALEARIISQYKRYIDPD